MYIAMKRSLLNLGMNHAYIVAWSDDEVHEQYGSKVKYQITDFGQEIVSVNVKPLDIYEDDNTVIIQVPMSFKVFCNRLTYYANDESIEFGYFGNNCARRATGALKLADVQLDTKILSGRCCKHLMLGIFAPVPCMITPGDFLRAAKQYKRNQLTDIDALAYQRAVERLGNHTAELPDNAVKTYLQRLLISVNDKKINQPELVQTLTRLLHDTHELFTDTADFDNKKFQAYATVVKKVMQKEPQLLIACAYATQFVSLLAGCANGAWRLATYSNDNAPVIIGGFLCCGASQLVAVSILAATKCDPHLLDSFYHTGLELSLNMARLESQKPVTMQK